MQADRFTIKSQEALAAASRVAEARRNPQVTPLHLLAALLTEADRTGAAPAPSADAPGGVVLPVLAKLGVQVPALRESVERALGALPVLGEGTAGDALAQPGSALLPVLRAGGAGGGALAGQYASPHHLL